MKPWLIAHRGNQVNGRQNTIAAFKATNQYPIGMVELDVHTTSDGVVICHHDFEIKDKLINEHVFNDLKKLDPDLTTLDEALAVIGPSINIILEIKPAHGTAEKVTDLITNRPEWWAASYEIEALHTLANSGIDKSRLFLLQHKHPLTHIKRAKMHGYQLAINKHYLTPDVYFRAKRNCQQIYTYTVNSLVLAWIFRKLYPDVSICTDQPDKLQRLK